MKRIVQAGVFKAQCLKIMDEVQKTHVPILITKYGKTVAKLIPESEKKVTLFGKMKGSVKIKGDLLKPIEEDWNADS